MRSGEAGAGRRLDQLWLALAGVGLCAPILKWIPHAQQNNGRILAIALPILIGSALPGLWLGGRAK